MNKSFHFIDGEVYQCYTCRALLNGFESGILFDLSGYECIICYECFDSERHSDLPVEARAQIWYEEGANTEGNEERRLSLLKESVRIHPTANACSMLGNMLKDPIDAEKIIDTALRLEPGHISALILKGHLLAAQGKLDEALNHIENHAAGVISSVHLKARLLKDMERFAEAVGCFKQIVSECETVHDIERCIVAWERPYWCPTARK